MKSLSLRLLGTLVIVLALAAVSSATASATNFLYWTDFNNGTLVRQSLDGGGAEVVVANAGSDPNGVTIDRRTGLVYWAVRAENQIRVSQANGSNMLVLGVAGAPIDAPVGVAIDDRTNRIYWANASSSTIGWAALDGSDGGALDTGAAPISGPQGILVDTISDRVYWANAVEDGSVNPIGWVNLSDSSVSGGVGVPDFGTGPIGLALDANNELLYWVGFTDSLLRAGNAEGTIEEVIASTPLNFPGGVTFNPLDGKLYISNFGAGEIVKVSPQGGDAVVFSSGGSPWGQAAVSGAGKLTAPTLSIASPIGATTAGVLQLTNSGDYPLIIRGASASPSVFAIGSGCPTIIAVNEVCDLTIRFTPTSNGEVAGTISVPTDTGTFTLNVTGTIALPQTLAPELKNVHAVKRCAASAAAGSLSVAYTSAIATATTVTLQRSSSRRRTPPSKCPKRASNSDYDSRGIGKTNTRSFSALAGTQSATLKQLFKTKKLAPGRYRMLFSYKNAAGATVRKGTWFWVLK